MNKCKDLSFFDRYPQLNSLRNLVSDELILEELAAHEKEFEKDLARADESIPSVNLNQIFPMELEKGKIYLENFLGHWGNVSIEELCKICLIVRYFKPKKILEIGTYNGMTTLQMALNAPKECQIYTLDLPEQKNTINKLSKVDFYLTELFKKKYGTETGVYFKNRKDLNIIQLFGDSAIFDYSVTGGKIDIIFIDAAHDYENKKKDTENALRLLAPNGVIIWHNYRDISNPAVTKYLVDMKEKIKIFHLRNTLLAIYWNSII